MVRQKTILEFAALSVILAILPLMSATVPAVHAYGNTALWQLGVSFNCNNPDFCIDPATGQPQLGGLWGWVEFDNGGLGDATLTGCGHLTGPTSHGSGGADHFNAEITGWTVMPGSAGPMTFFVTSGTMTFTGTVPRGPPITMPISPTPFDTGFPAVPGHFSMASVLGFTPPPGVNFQIQVVQLTH